MPSPTFRMLRHPKNLHFSNFCPSLQNYRSEVSQINIASFLKLTSTAILEQSHLSTWHYPQINLRSEIIIILIYFLPFLSAIYMRKEISISITISNLPLMIQVFHSEFSEVFRSLPSVVGGLSAKTAEKCPKNFPSCRLSPMKVWRTSY